MESTHVSLNKVQFIVDSVSVLICLTNKTKSKLIGITGIWKMTLQMQEYI